MNKKNILYILLGIVFCAVLFNMLGKAESEVQEGPEKDLKRRSFYKVKRPSKVFKRKEVVKKEPVEKKVEDVEPEVNKEFSEEELDKISNFIEGIETGWRDRITNLFLDELGLPEETLQSYFDIRDRYEQEKLTAYEDFHEDMLSKYGDEYSFNPTEDEDLYDGEILDRYFNQIRDLLGADNFKPYLYALDEYNESIKKGATAETGITEIDI